MPAALTRQAVFWIHCKPPLNKNFRTRSPAVVRECQQNFNFLHTESQLEIRTAKFLQAFSATKNTLCLLFKQRAVTQLDGIFGKYKPNVIRSAIVSWHAHYVVNNELIISTLCTFCTMFLCFCLIFFRAFLLYFSIIATSFLVNKGEYIGEWLPVKVDVLWMRIPEIF